MVAKADNLLAMLWLLRSRGRLTAAELAEALEVTPRTVYRYIDALSAAGVPVIAEPGPGGGYRLSEGFRSTPLFFTPEELSALFWAARLVAAAGHPAAAALDRALAKLQRTLTPEQLAVLEAELAAVAVSIQRRDRPQPEALRTLLDAARGWRTVRIRYRKPGAPAEDRVIEPHRAAWRDGAWYVVAWDVDRRARRDFRADRIECVELLPQTFTPRTDLLVSDEDPDVWVPRRLRAAPRTVTVRLRPAGRAAHVSLVEHWYLRHCLVAEDEGVLVFRIDPVGYRHLPRFLLGFAGDVTVLAPAALRRAVARLASRVAAHHRQSPQKPPDHQRSPDEPPDPDRS